MKSEIPLFVQIISFHLSASDQFIDKFILSANKRREWHGKLALMYLFVNITSLQKFTVFVTATKYRRIMTDPFYYIKIK